MRIFPGSRAVSVEFRPVALTSDVRFKIFISPALQSCVLTYVPRIGSIKTFRDIMVSLTMAAHIQQFVLGIISAVPV